MRSSLRKSDATITGALTIVRRSENGVTVADEPVIHRPPAGRVSERAVNENNGGTGHDEFLSSHGQLGCPLLDSSGDFFEVAEAESLDHLGLHGRDVFVGLVRAERRANDRGHLQLAGPPYHRLHSVLHAGWLALYLGRLAPGLVSRRHMFW